VNWYEPIQLASPTILDIELGRIWRFTFSAKTHLRATAAPPTGTDVSDIYQFSSLGCVGITGFGARVKSARVITFRGDLAMLVEIIEPQGYSANATGPELRGSRKEPNQDRNFKYGQMLFISTDGKTGVPAIGSKYFTPPPSGSTIESGLHGRICKSVTDDWDMVPGLCISTATFIGAEAYPSATPEIKGSRTTTQNDIWRLGVMKYISRDGSTGVAIPGTTSFTTSAGLTEIGLTGRRCKSLSDDWDTIPGLCITTASFIGATPYVTGGDGPEIKGSRKERRNKDNKNTGEMLFLSTTTTGGVPVPGQTYFTNADGTAEGGLNGRVCNDVVQDTDTIPGTVFTRAHFLTSGWGEIRQPGVARVSIRGLTQQEEMTHEPEANGGKCIQGPFLQTDFVPGRYIITKGEVSSLRKKAIITIETAYTKLNPAALLSYVDTVNSNYLTNLGLPARSCRMLAPGATRWWRQGALWYANYAMLYDPKKKHNEVEVQRQTKMPFKLPKLNENGLVLNGEFSPVYEWVNKKSKSNAIEVTDVDPETRKPWIERSWADLDGMISWD